MKMNTARLIWGGVNRRQTAFPELVKESRHTRWTASREFRFVWAKGEQQTTPNTFTEPYQRFGKPGRDEDVPNCVEGSRKYKKDKIVTFKAFVWWRRDDFEEVANGDSHLIWKGWIEDNVGRQRSQRPSQLEMTNSFSVTHHQLADETEPVSKSRHFLDVFFFIRNSSPWPSALDSEPWRAELTLNSSQLKLPRTAQVQGLGTLRCWLLKCGWVSSSPCINSSFARYNLSLGTCHEMGLSLSSLKSTPRGGWFLFDLFVIYYFPISLDLPIWPNN